MFSSASVFWTAIQESCARSDREFDFGRTDLGNEGLRRFKSGWGGVERPLVYSSLAPGADGPTGGGREVAAKRFRRSDRATERQADVAHQEGAPGERRSE